MPNSIQTIRIIRRGEVVSLNNVPPTRTLLEVLREDLSCTGTKEGCGEGDCGACTVVLGEADTEHEGKVRFRAINSCIRLAHSVDGMALWTVEDIAAEDGTLHPAQTAMVENHASQCGFCTPGFVMSMFGMYQNHIAPTLVTSCTALPPEGAAAPANWQSQIRGPNLKGSCPTPISRELAQEELSGNLCRCTGYRPILDAAQAMGSLPPVSVDEADLLLKLQQIVPDPVGLQANLPYKSPQTLPALLQARADNPAAQIVAGCTDVGLWVTKMHMQFGQVLDVTKVHELRQIEDTPRHLTIGAAVTLADAYAALVRDRPQLHSFAARFAGLPVRNSGTLGGNVANGSPIGDSMPLLIALGASVVLASVRGERELPLEKLYTGYRKNVMAADEVLAFIRVPKPGSPHPNPLPGGEGMNTKDERETAMVPAGALAPLPPSSSIFGEGWGEGPERLRVYKISKRYDDDISAVCLAINLHVENGIVTSASIGAGGVAATPLRAVQTEAALLGQPWSLQTVQQAITTLRAEFSPISDMRASAAYRSGVMGNLLQRYWLESQGLQQINLASFKLEETA